MAAHVCNLQAAPVTIALSCRRKGARSARTSAARAPAGQRGRRGLGEGGGGGGGGCPGRGRGGFSRERHPCDTPDTPGEPWGASECGVIDRPTPVYAVALAVLARLRRSDLVFGPRRFSLCFRFRFGADCMRMLGRSPALMPLPFTVAISVSVGILTLTATSGMAALATASSTVESSFTKSGSVLSSRMPRDGLGSACRCGIEYTVWQHQRTRAPAAPSTDCVPGHVRPPLRCVTWVA